MSETDNATPVEENVAPVQEEATPVSEQTQATKLGKFGELLEYAPDDIKEAKTWEKFKDVDIPTALKAIVDMDKWTGKKGDIPTDWNDEAAVKEFYSKIGVPESPDGYEFGLDESVVAALGNDADSMTSYIGEMKTLGLKHNIPAKSMDGFLADAMAHEMGLRGAMAEATQEAVESKMKELTDEWGDQFDAMGASVQNLEKHYGLTDAEMDEVEASPLFNKLLGRIAKDLDEKGQVGNTFSQTKIGLKDELAEIEGKIHEILAATKGDVNDPRLGNLFDRKRRLDHKLA